MMSREEEVLDTVSAHTGMLKSAAWLKNIRINQRTTGFSRTTRELIDKHKGEKAVVIGAGPAFKRFGYQDLNPFKFSYTETNYDDIIIIACDGALPTLAANNIKPDYVCFAPNTLIVTRRGAKEIETIVNGDEVLSHDGKYHQVKQTMKRYYKGQVMKIRLRNSNIDVIATPNHPFLVKDVSWSKKWIPASQLKSGGQKDRNKSGYRCSKVHYPITKAINIPKVVFNRPIRTSNGRTFLWSYQAEESEVTSDLARIFGYYVAEGSSKKNLYFHFGNEEELVKDTLNVIRTFFNLQSGSIDRRSNNINVEFGPSLVNIFDDFGHGAENKRVPVWMIDAPLEIQREFIRGYFLGDGNIHPDCFRATTISCTLAFQIRDMLLRLGIVSGVSKHNGRKVIFPNRTLPSNCKPSYIIRVSGGSLKEMSQLMRIDHPFLSKRKNSYRGTLLQSGWKGSEERDVYALFTPIRKASQEEYEGYVYNLEVVETETYALAVGAIVHNCSVDCHPVVADFYRTYIEMGGRPFIPLLSTTVHKNVVQVIKENFSEVQSPIHWWQAFAKDDRQLSTGVGGGKMSKFFIDKVQTISTGGNVGTTSMIIATMILGCRPIGLLGLEFSWSDETPLYDTQYYAEIMRIVGGDEEAAKNMYHKKLNRRDGKTYIADDCYYSYWLAFKELWRLVPKPVRNRIFNLTREGILTAEGLRTISMDEFLRKRCG